MRNREIEIVSSASLSIHLPLGGNFQVVSQEFHPNFFPDRSCCSHSFEIRLQTRNPNFQGMSDKKQGGVHGPENLGLSVQELEMIRLVWNIFDRFQKHPLCVSFSRPLSLCKKSLCSTFYGHKVDLCVCMQGKMRREWEINCFQIVCSSCTKKYFLVLSLYVREGWTQQKLSKSLSLLVGLCALYKILA